RRRRRSLWWVRRWAWWRCERRWHEEETMMEPQERPQSECKGSRSGAHAIVVAVCVTICGMSFGQPETLPHAAPSSAHSFLFRSVGHGKDGCGGSSATLCDGTKEVYKKELPFTVQTSAVTDEGQVFGVAYLNGVLGQAFGCPTEKDDLVLAF